MSDDGPFKRLDSGVISGPIPLVEVPGLPGLVLLSVDLVNRLYQLGRLHGKLEEEVGRRVRKSRIASVIADLELDLEPPPNFEELRKKPP